MTILTLQCGFGVVEWLTACCVCVVFMLEYCQNLNAGKC